MTGEEMVEKERLYGANPFPGLHANVTGMSSHKSVTSPGRQSESQ